ncbi:O-Antigen ligase [Colwellia chukchiensis]|uniref:O-Antigen ligase n=1 Tax=Colwellia chukchiensis TaxID=641665 RepID=A0A1H7PUF2_9GAMM|nr:O-antigen ligase family protein [Colwellia chukchiensis]SEL39206.1 O-Antigen ligase [Colwellia chukchiensis]
MRVFELARNAHAELVLCALFIALYAFTASAPFLLLIVGLGVIAAMILPFARSLQLVFFLLPCADIFSQSPYISISLLTFILLAIFGRYLLTHVMATQFYQPGLIVMLLVLLYELMHVFYNPVMLASTTIRWAILFLFTSLLLFDRTQYVAFSQLRLVLLWGVIMSAFYGLISAYFAPLASEPVKAITRFSGAAGDPNNFGLLCLLVLYFYLPVIPRAKITKSVRVIMLLMLSFGALTVSRSFFIVATCSLVAYFLLYYRSALGDMLVRMLLALNGLLILFCFYWLSGFSSLGELDILTRFNADNLAQLTGSRSVILQEYSALFLQLSAAFMLFGAGINGYLGYYNHHFLQAGVFSDAVGPHNTFLEILISFGLLGSWLLFSYIYFAFRAQRSRVASAPIFRLAWLPILVFILYCFSLQNLAKYTSYFVLMLIVYNTYRKDD